MIYLLSRLKLAKIWYIYVEVKGFYDDKDLAKWEYFTEKLFVLKAKEIKMINEDMFMLEEIIKGCS